MLELPSVTLLGVETRAHELLRLTILDAIAKVKFADVVIHTDKTGLIPVPNARYFRMPDMDCDKHNDYVVRDSFASVKTPFALFLEWDAGIHDPGCWTDEFLNYDYIGAPWWYTDGLNVGNGGFSIRSKRLTDFLRHNWRKYPANTDNKICRDYRRQLEGAGGFAWAPDELAGRFAVEPITKDRDLRTFGYHRCWHWPRVLSRDDCSKRIQVMNEAQDNGPHYYRKETSEEFT